MEVVRNNTWEMVCKATPDLTESTLISELSQSDNNVIQPLLTIAEMTQFWTIREFFAMFHRLHLEFSQFDNFCEIQIKC